MRWHLLTGEYPPASGGVGDYTALLAQALADAGDSVDVWVAGPVETPVSVRRRVHQLPDRFGPRSRAVLAEAWASAPATVLLQYVPNALGARGANFMFCRWLLSQRRAGRDIRVMFHEPYFYFSPRRPWRIALAIVQRAMAATLIRASARLYYSSAAWHRYLRPYGAPSTATVLPIPSTIPDDADAGEVRAFRESFGPLDAQVVGHFGTFGRDVAGELRAILPDLMARNPALHLALIGRDGERFQGTLAARFPDAAARVHATGRLPPRGIAAALRACDLLVQPYPDGVTTRRTSVMAGLRNGIATVSTAGPLTEPVWRDSRAAALAPPGDSAAVIAAIERLLSDARARAEQAELGSDAYERHFAMDVTLARLRSSVETPVSL